MLYVNVNEDRKCLTNLNSSAVICYFCHVGFELSKGKPSLTSEITCEAYVTRSRAEVHWWSESG